MALKRAGRGHDPGGIDETSKGELLVECPACPHPGKNLPDDWEKAGPLLYAFFHFLFPFFVSLILYSGFYIYSTSPSTPTSNSKGRSDISQTSSSCPDWRHMFQMRNTRHMWLTTSINRRYVSYLFANRNNSSAINSQINSCKSQHDALVRAATRSSPGYAVSGAVVVICSRHCMIRRNGAGDLQKGEK